MSGLRDVCPSCDADLQGDPIPEASAHMYSATHFSRVIGHEVRGVYDGTLYWSCPDCEYAWPRWTDGGRLTEQAAHYAADWNQRGPT